MGEQPDNSIINSEEERQRALGGDPAQQAAADGLEAGLRAKAAQNAATPDPAPEPSTGPSLGEAPPTDAPQASAQPAQPPQAPVAVAEAPAVEKASPGHALGLNTPPKTITATGAEVVADSTEEKISPVVRRFACAKQPNGKKLVRAGQLRRIVDPNSPSGLKDFARDGDKFVTFTAGLSQETRDLEIIQFCEDHPSIYDVDDPTTGLKFDLEQIQQPTATREAVVLPGIDLNKALNGESPDSGLTGDSPIAAARRQVQEANQQV